MNTATHLGFQEFIFAGGVGSGCQGPNCGRPAGSGFGTVGKMTPLTVKELHDLQRGAPKPGAKLTQKVAGWANKGYDALKSDEAIVQKVETTPSRARAILAKQAWFVKRLGDLTQSWEGFGDLAKTIFGIMEKMTKVIIGVGSLHEVAVALHYAVIHLAPIIARIGLAVIAGH